MCRLFRGKAACFCLPVEGALQMALIAALISASGGGKLKGELHPPFLLAAGCHSREAHMPPLLSAPEVLNREFLEIRCKILDLAAGFDRLDRADGSVAEDPRLPRLREALSVVLESTGDRAEQVQMIFSRDYDDNWQKTLNVNVE